MLGVQAESDLSLFLGADCERPMPGLEGLLELSLSMLVLEETSWLLDR